MPGKLSSRNMSTKSINDLKSKTLDGKFFDAKSILDEPKNELECQSDVMIGQHFCDNSMLDEDDERKTNSDYHEMFYVNELFKDDLKFCQLLSRG
jgi:hypothetical protein